MIIHWKDCILSPRVYKTTNVCFEKHLWQLRYWDHIIRNENDYIRIENYIINNPVIWDEDKFKI